MPLRLAQAPEVGSIYYLLTNSWRAAFSLAKIVSLSFEEFAHFQYSGHLQKSETSVYKLE